MELFCCFRNVEFNGLQAKLQHLPDTAHDVQYIFTIKNHVRVTIYMWFDVKLCVVKIIGFWCECGVCSCSGYSGAFPMTAATWPTRIYNVYKLSCFLTIFSFFLQMCLVFLRFFRVYDFFKGEIEIYFFAKTSFWASKWPSLKNGKLNIEFCVVLFVYIGKRIWII